MSGPVRALAEGSGDFRLCDTVFALITQRRKFQSCWDLPEPERIVYLVWGATGVIGNGGFRYLFERNLAGDPHFWFTQSSLKKIGCAEAATAFLKALAVFPEGKPHEDIDERLRYWRQEVGGATSEMDCEFWEAKDEIDRCLAAYILANEGSFSHLFPEPPGGQPAPDSPPAESPRRSWWHRLFG